MLRSVFCLDLHILKGAYAIFNWWLVFVSPIQVSIDFACILLYCNLAHGIVEKNMIVLDPLEKSSINSLQFENLQ